MQDAIGRDDPMVLSDVQGNAMLEGTTGGLHEFSFTFSFYVDWKLIELISTTTPKGHTTGNKMHERFLLYKNGMYWLLILYIQWLL